MTSCRTIEILMAEDDPQDQLLVREAFRRAQVANHLNFVNDGEELLDYLCRRGPFAEAVRPDLILVDLNMPRKDGREAISQIKSDANLRGIPIVVLTSSGAEEDIVHSYDLGVSSYIRKPVTFEKLVEVIRTLRTYWIGIVELPPNHV